MSSLDISIIAIFVLWLYNSLSQIVCARHYEDYLDETELSYKDESATEKDSPAADSQFWVAVG